MKKTISPMLKPGDTLGVCAPSGAFEAEPFERGLDVIRKMGFKVYLPDSIHSKKRYLAGDDALRADSVNTLFAMDEIKAIVCARGGFGVLRMLSHVDYDLIKQHPKPFVGFSDITALLFALVQRAHISVIHGPVVTSLGFAEQETKVSFFNALTCQPSAITLQKGSPVVGGMASGTLIGGNLATLVHLTGTRFEPDLTGCILFLEDIGEPAYKIDRMLTHLKMADVLSGINGVLLGSFHDCGDDTVIMEIVSEIFHDMNVPVLAGFLSGHGRMNLSLPMGFTVNLDADNHRLAWPGNDVP